MQIVESRAINLSTSGDRIVTPKMQIHPLTSRIEMVLRRPTSANGVRWDELGMLRTRIAWEVDGQTHFCTGKVTGGIRRWVEGREIEFYRLRVNPGVRMVNGRARRIGELAKSRFEAYVLFELLSGRVETELIVAQTFEQAAPLWTDHHSVAYDDATDAFENAGDGVLTLDHTSTGANRAAFGINSNAETPAALQSASMTYAAAGMTEMWDVQSLYMGQAGYRIVNQATGLQEVVGTLSASAPAGQFMALISMTGVDQSTPVGTPQTYTSTSDQAPDVTVPDVGADDLVVDALIAGGASNFSEGDLIPTAPEQTLCTDADNGADSMAQATSRQAGSDGGLMSWAIVGVPGYGSVLGAVNFKAAGGAAGPSNVKTVHGAPIASVKTVHGVPIASVKTIHGVN